ncbi:MAG: amidophosphoribosyltransferase [Myxococcales bacterium]|nr:amidophosphoribosyltransferase [Myxococcales bacterium]
MVSRRGRENVMQEPPIVRDTREDTAQSKLCGRAGNPHRGLIHSVQGSLSQEADFSLRDLLPEECGLAAAINMPEASRFVYDCLMLQEHRGEHGAGIISYNGKEFSMRRHLGSVRENFHGVDVSAVLPGDVAIGHGRYATRGSFESGTNVQPLFFHASRFGSFAIAHNGQLADPRRVRDRLVQQGVLFQSTTDSELFGHLITQSFATNIEDAIVEACRQIEVAYALIILCEDKVIVLRDRYGVRPLSFGKMSGGYLVCSENYAMDQYPDCEHLGDLAPGEMVIFQRGREGYRRIQYAKPDEHFCIFEGIYFSDPRTRYNGFWHEDFRYELGRQIARENPDLEGDCIIPVLDSGKHAAVGLSEISGIPYREYFKRLHNPPRAKRRSFTSATYEDRVRTAYQKLHLREEKIKGKRVIVVDDSIVRSTTIRIINQRLREAGATSIVNCISAPAIVDVCPFGMDFQDRSQLIAHHRSTEEIADAVGADRVIYVRLQGLEELVAKTYQCGICSGCFGGRYPMSSEGQSE